MINDSLEEREMKFYLFLSNLETAEIQGDEFFNTSMKLHFCP